MESVTIEVVIGVLTFAGGIVGVYVSLSNKIAKLESEVNGFRKEFERERTETGLRNERLILMGENLSEMRVLLAENLKTINATLLRHERDFETIFKHMTDGKRT